MKLIGNLIHFILVQVGALTAAIIARMTNVWWIEYLTLLLLFYAVFVTFAAGIQLFLTAVIYNTKESVNKEAEVSEKQPF